MKIDIESIKELKKGGIYLIEVEDPSLSDMIGEVGEKLGIKFICTTPGLIKFVEPKMPQQSEE